jgi:acyl-CoA synthetase (AMP-forming)/AMP-acid ligase II
MLLDIPASIVSDDAVLVWDGGQHTYESLRNGVAQAAGLLASLGVGPGDRVAILAVNCPELAEVLFATAAAGATIVPMNFRAGTEELAHLLSDSGSRVLFTQKRYAELVDRVKPETLASVVLLDEGYASARDAAEGAWDIADVEDEELSALLYTSGTTSLPKGVMLTHGALSGYVLGSAECADGEPKGRTLLAAPLYHIAGLTSLLLSVYSGRSTILLSQFEAGAWLDAVERHRATHAFLVPTMLARVIDHPDFASRELSSLELVTYGAAPMPQTVIRRAIEVFPASVGFSGAYGQTETTSTVTVLGVEDHQLDGSPEKERRLGSVGRPMDDVELRVVDEDGKPLQPGEPGEVQLRTGRVMEGYWGAKEKTRVTLDDEGWVHTGDLGYLDEEGYLFLSGRSSDLIIRGGENIAPEEVEAVLYEHRGVADAAVIGVPDEEWGERVVAAVVASDPGLDEAALLAHCSSRLASFKRPERVLLLDDLPRTSTGKLVRRDIRPIVQELLKAGGPGGGSDRRER